MSASDNDLPISPRRWPRRSWLLWALVAVVIGGVLAGGGLWARTKQRERDRREALRLSGVERFEDARPGLLLAYERNPDDLDVVKALARGSTQVQRFDDADLYLARWCALQPNVVEPFLRRMELALQRGDIDRVVAVGQRLLEIEPDNAPLSQRVFISFLTNGRHVDSERVLRGALARKPRDVALRYYLAEALHGQGRDGDACALLDPLLRDQPRHLDALMLRAVIHREAGEDDRAIPLFRQVLAVNPNSYPARYYLSLSLGRVGQTKEAEQELARALKLSEADRLLVDKDFQPDNTALQVKAAEALLNADRKAEALGQLRAILTRDPRNASAQKLLELAQRPRATTPP